MGRRGSETSLDEKSEGPAGNGFAGGFLRRQKEEDSASRSNSRSNSRGPGTRRRRWDAGRGPGGPISQSAIGPIARLDLEKGEATPTDGNDAFGDAMAVSTSDSSSNGKEKMKQLPEKEGEIFQEGNNTVIEDEEGNVLGVRDSHGEHGAQRRQHDGERAMELLREEDVQHGVAQKEHGSPLEEAPGKIETAVEHPHKTWRKRMQSFSGHHHNDGEEKQASKSKQPEQKRGPALAYQFGNTIIVEDEDGEVIKKYDIPSAPKAGKDGRPTAQRGQSMVETSSRAIQSLKRMGTHMGVPQHTDAGPSGTGATESKKKKKPEEEEDDDRLRFTVTAGGRRMSKLEFIQQMAQMNPKDRAKFVQSSNAPEAVKTAAQEDAKDLTDAQRRGAASKANVPPIVGEEGQAEIQKIESPAAEREGRTRGPEGLTLVDSNNEDVPFHSVRQDLADYSMGGNGETAAARRRRLASQHSSSTQVGSRKENAADQSSDEETPAERRRRLAALQGSSSPPPPTSSERRPVSPKAPDDNAFEGETAAERRRRLGALGVGGQQTPESDSEDEETGDPLETGRGTHDAKAKTKGPLSPPRTPGIRFAEQPRVPTKDERAKEDAREKEGKEGKSGLSKLIRRK